MRMAEPRGRVREQLLLVVIVQRRKRDRERGLGHLNSRRETRKESWEREPGGMLRGRREMGVGSCVELDVSALSSHPPRASDPMATSATRPISLFIETDQTGQVNRVLNSQSLSGLVRLLLDELLRLLDLLRNRLLGLLHLLLNSLLDLLRLGLDLLGQTLSLNLRVLRHALGSRLLGDGSLKGLDLMKNER